MYLDDGQTNTKVKESKQMEIQRAPYLKNLKRKSDMDKFINRRNESNSVEKTVVERLNSQICFDISFQALIEEAAKKIDEQEKKITEQADKIKTLENVLRVRNKVIDKYRKGTEKTTLFLNSI